MTPQKMMLFQCNSCLALAEQRKRQQMREEDIAAQADARKRQALEEKRNWAAKKRKRENEEARRRLRQVMAEHERTALQDALNEAREKVRLAFENIAPEDTKSIIKSKYLQKAVCYTCGFPGHKPHQCPFPREKIASTSTSRGVIAGHDSNEDASAGGAQKKKARLYCCSICGSYSHGRLQCPSIKPEQREEYESRIKWLNVFADHLGEVKILKELERSIDLTHGLSQDIESKLQNAVHDILRRMGLPHLIVEPHLSVPAPKASSAPRPEALKQKAEKAAPKMKVPLRVKSLGLAKAAKGKGKGKSANSSGGRVSGTQQNLAVVQVALHVADGLACGWELRGGLHPNGIKYLRYRRPGEAEFIGQKEALVDLDPHLHEAIQAERAQVLQELENLWRKGKTQSKPKLIEPRSSTKPSPAPGSQDTDAILPGYVHMYKFPSGPAMDWTMRIKVSGNGTLIYSYKSPNSSRWEYTVDQFKLGVIWQEIQSVRDIHSKHIRSKIAMSSRGAAIGAAMKRKKELERKLLETQRNLHELEASRLDDASIALDVKPVLKRSKPKTRASNDHGGNKVVARNGGIELHTNGCSGHIIDVNEGNDGELVVPFGDEEAPNTP